jgi:hypothetical protein
VVSRTKKHNEVGSQRWPSKGTSSLPMPDSEEAKKYVVKLNVEE